MLTRRATPFIAFVGAALWIGVPPARPAVTMKMTAHVTVTSVTAAAHSVAGSPLLITLSHRVIARTHTVRLTVTGRASGNSMLDVLELVGGPRTCNSSEAVQLEYSNSALFNSEPLRATVSGAFTLTTGPLIQVTPGRAVFCAHLDAPDTEGQVTPAQAVARAVLTVRGHLTRNAALSIPLFDDGYNAPITERIDMILPGCRETLRATDVCPQFTTADALVAPLLPSEAGVTFVAWLVKGRGNNPNISGPPGLTDPHCGTPPANALTRRRLTTSSTVTIPVHLAPRATQTLCWELTAPSGTAINPSTMPESATIHGP
jgi:hypothetical protein